jgi:hypothetical protein
MYGQVAASPRVLLDKPLLDVLGIRFLVADPEEKVAQGLEPALRLPYSSKERPPLVLYVNPGAWPDAVVLAPEAKEYSLPLLPDCGHEALMCRDFSGLAAMRLPGESVEARWEPGGDLELSLPPAPRPRLVLVNQAYRQGWRAGWRGSGGQGQTEVFVLAGGLTGLEVPPGAELVRLEFRPAPRLLLYGLSWVLLAAVAASVVALALLGHRARLRGRRPDRDLANSPAQGR